MERSNRIGSPRGPGTISLALVAVASMVAAAGYWLGRMDGSMLDALRVTIRVTARQSLLLFLLAYAASALATVFPSDFTRWLRQYRRSLGLAFAASHGWHLVAIIALARLFPADFQGLTNVVTIYAGSITYVLIAAMALTSFDFTAKAIGPRLWGRLHSIGAVAIWSTFMASEAKRLSTMPIYVLGVALLLAVIVLRVVAKRRNLRRSTE